jgi:hypothetical protein
MKVAYLGLKGSIKSVIARLQLMDDKEFKGLKASAVSAAAKREKGAR